MVFRYFDEHMGEIAMEELSKMEIWNPTMEHIFAQTMKRIEEGKGAGSGAAGFLYAGGREGRRGKDRIRLLVMVLVQGNVILCGCVKDIKFR